MVTVPVAAHEGNRLINWLISQINAQNAGATTLLAYTNWIGGGGTGQAVIPAMEPVAASAEAEAPKEGEQTQAQETQQQHQSAENNHRPRRR
jgi:hypothetical protein